MKDPRAFRGHQKLWEHYALATSQVPKSGTVSFSLFWLKYQVLDLLNKDVAPGNYVEMALSKMEGACQVLANPSHSRFGLWCDDAATQ